MFCRASTLAAALCFVHAAHATESPALTLFENVRIFDGKSEALSASMNVLVRGNTIEKISKDPIPIDGSSPAKVIAGGGRTLMPGLIDAHWHTMLVRPTPAALLVDDVGYLKASVLEKLPPCGILRCGVAEKKTSELKLQN